MRAFGVIVVTALASCARAPADATPEGALDAFLRAVEEAPNDPTAPVRAYSLLASPARDALKLRASRAAALTGKAATPQSMLVPSWAPLHFAIERTTTTWPAGKAAPQAIVDVSGIDPATQHATIPMVREGDRWRISLDIPPGGTTTAD